MVRAWRTIRAMREQNSNPIDANTRALSSRLRVDRELSNMSLRSAATRAEISSAYLSQLEAGAIKTPSPHILLRLSQIYESSYADLMRLAGYVLPVTENEPSSMRSQALELALRSKSPLTDEERAALSEYLAWYRSRKGKPPEEI